MKISDRFPSIGRNEAAEEETSLQSQKLIEQDKYKGPGSIHRDQIESRVEKYKGPDSTNRNLHNIPEDVFDNIPTPGNAAAIEGALRGFLNRLEEANDSAPKISSPVNKYKGPDHLNLPEIESRVEKYKGPGFIQPPQIESKVDKYKGPKSLPEEPRIESAVNKYKGPDSTNRNLHNIPETVFDNIPTPGNAAAIEGALRGFLNRLEEANDSAPKISSPVNKYKGPDAIQVPSDSKSGESERSASSNRSSGKSNEKSSTQDSLLRLQIENQLGKAKR